jgi:osmotically-inducible protein OsmY
MANETAIADGIRAEYVRDSRITNPAEVAIAVKDGTVTLRGTVGSIKQRRAAAEIAKSAHGVRAVEDELSVSPLARPEDLELKGAALQALMSSDDAPADRIDVSVDGAWVTLKGEVKHQHESDAAFAAVSGLPGSGGITNAIKVVSPTGT